MTHDGILPGLPSTDMGFCLTTIALLETSVLKSSFFLSRKVRGRIKIFVAMTVTDTSSILVCEPQPHLAPFWHCRLLTIRPTPVPWSKYLFLYISSAIPQCHKKDPSEQEGFYWIPYEWSSNLHHSSICLKHIGIRSVFLVQTHPLWISLQSPWTFINTGVLLHFCAPIPRDSLCSFCLKGVPTPL